MSDELKATIKQAIIDGKTITVDLKTPTIDESKVESDAAKVKDLVGTDSNIAGYFDITVAVSIDGTQVGVVTLLDNEVDITLPIPTSLPKVKAGYARTFKVVKVHDGIAKELDTTTNSNDTLTFKSGEFSTYAITYKDVKIISNPNTSDNIITYIIVGIISMFGIMITLVTNKINQV